jgi:hypothetical protein
MLGLRQAFPRIEGAFYLIVAWLLEGYFAIL